MVTSIMAIAPILHDRNPRRVYASKLNLTRIQDMDMVSDVATDQIN